MMTSQNNQNKHTHSLGKENTMSVIDDLKKAVETYAEKTAKRK